jgi:hypothetical protein
LRSPYCQQVGTLVQLVVPVFHVRPDGRRVPRCARSAGTGVPPPAERSTRSGTAAPNRSCPAMSLGPPRGSAPGRRRRRRRASPCCQGAFSSVVSCRAFRAVCAASCSWLSVVAAGAAGRIAGRSLPRAPAPQEAAMAADKGKADGTGVPGRGGARLGEWAKLCFFTPDGFGRDHSM